MRIKRNGALAAVSAIAALTLVTACGGGDTQTVSGEGSTAQQKAMEHFSQILSDDSDIVLDYTGSGSGDAGAGLTSSDGLGETSGVGSGSGSTFASLWANCRCAAIARLMASSSSDCALP